VFCSFPDQVLVVRLAADQPGRISFRASLRRSGARVECSGPDMLVMSGQAGMDGKTEGVMFVGALKAVTNGGHVRADSEGISVSRADAVTLLLAASSDYNIENPAQPLARSLARVSLATIAAAAARSYGSLKERSVTDHRRLFRRVELRLTPAERPGLPTDERLAAVRTGAQDPGLVELYFQYGRYLLISSSRPGSLPANLQGIWNKDLSAPGGPTTTSTSTSR
jgi:alpha-L-fucosidase 2